jgi:pimeloyl-ACP methyl ester carboxylesterase
MWFLYFCPLELEKVSLEKLMKSATFTTVHQQKSLWAYKWPAFLFVLAVWLLLLSRSGMMPSKPVTKGWTDCSTKEMKLECTFIQVPMDYDDPQSPMINIALNKYTPPNATHYVLLNPGGPGGSGKHLVKRAGKMLSASLGDQLILIGFDPRGIGESNSVSCGVNFRSEIGLASQFSSHFEGTVRDHEALAIAKLTAKECQVHTGKFLKFMSTNYVARDMDEIRKFLGMETMRYWGFSYGSVLGNTYANMFPNMATNIVIDGVVDPRSYYGTIFDFLRAYYSKMRESLVEFGRLCDTAPNSCALASPGTTTFNRLMNLARKLEKSPILVDTLDVPTLITKQTFLLIVRTMLYATSGWPAFAEAADKLDKGDPGLFASRYMASQGDVCLINPPTGSLFSGLGVLCADGTPAPDLSLDEMRALEISIGANFTADVGIRDMLGMLPCNFWGKDLTWNRFTGPWNHTFANPVLVVGTRFDPVTPWYEARDTTQLMNEGHHKSNAVLLTHDGHGHCSANQFSSCTSKYIREFLIDGIVPPSNAYCTADTPIFSDQPHALRNAISIDFSVYRPHVL